MAANTLQTENALLEPAVSWLAARLPKSWEVSVSTRSDLPGVAIDLRGPSGTFATMVVEAKQTFGPRNVSGLLGGVGRTLLAMAGNTPILVVAPWLSPRTREMLREEHLNYLDLTGNAWVQLDHPTLFIESQGAPKNPEPAQRGKARLQGPKAGRLIRVLADVIPPYGVRELAAATGLTPGYVSRLLATLDREAVIDRTSRGRVENVDVLGLLRRWSDTYGVFRSNKPLRYLAARGASALMATLASAPTRIAITGSFAAVRLAPVAGPALLAAYCETPSEFAEAFDLIPTDQGANVVLLHPFDPVVWERTTEHNGVTYVAPSQIAVDCLTGNGRMPAEGEALLRWMADNVAAWRTPGLADLASMPVTYE